MADPDSPPPLVVVISGPSGVGKDALVDRIVESRSDFARPVTMTTRPPRPGEVSGQDYIFTAREEFQRALDAGDLLEHAEIYGNLYGLPREQLRQTLDTGRNVIVRVDVQGVTSLRKLLPSAVFVMLIPGSLDELNQRLRERGDSHDDADLQRRIEEAELEMARQDLFDHIVMNIDGDLDATVERILAILAEERVKPDRGRIVV